MSQGKLKLLFKASVLRDMWILKLLKNRRQNCDHICNISPVNLGLDFQTFTSLKVKKNGFKAKLRKNISFTEGKGTVAICQNKVQL